jgi:histidyl-tRNA synthetase
MTARLWKELGIHDGVSLQINSLGSKASRSAHRQALVDYFEQHIDKLDEDSQRRLQTNPLRIFDSKVESTRVLFDKAPLLKDFLDDESREHFSKLLELLDAMGIAYEINPMLVRGLDYYSKTVFEWVTDRLGAQGTVCGGGRYDALIEQLGGKPSSAVGFGLGVERLLLLLEEMDVIPEEIFRTLDVYVVAAEDARSEAFKLAEFVRQQAPHLSVQTHCGSGSLRSQIKKADKSGALFALILGENEIENKQVSVKFLREEREQITVAHDELLSLLV